ncbi:olfactory receptor activity [Pristimantis euphronides]
MFLDFCGLNELNHFFCDLGPLQNLACSGPYISSTVTTTAATVGTVLPFMIIVGLYTKIIITVSNIKSSLGKRKAFSTCSSHLIVTMLFFFTAFAIYLRPTYGLFYGAAIIVYVKPKGSHYDKHLAFMYTAFTPMRNPFIYTFRNRDVKKVFWISMNRMIRLM